MPLHDILSSDIFRDATLDIGMRERGEGGDDAALLRCIEALATLAAEAPSLVEQSDAELVEVVDKVIRVFFPHHGRWDDPKLQKLIRDRAEIIRKIKDDEPVEVKDLHAAFRFCEEMWIELNGLNLRRYRKSRANI